MQRLEFQEEAGLIIDESADEKSGTATAGAGRQHNGRTGQIDECQIGVFLTRATPQANLWIDGQLFIPERWFGAAMAAHHKKAGSPVERQFDTKADFARLLVWTVHEGCVRQEWLLIRQDAEQATFTLSNAALGTPFATMAYRRSRRYFIERSNQDAKSELGWDEFQAIKFRAWEHQLALTILASWFVTETRLDRGAQFQRSPFLRQQYESDGPARALGGPPALHLTALVRCARLPPV